MNTRTRTQLTIQTAHGLETLTFTEPGLAIVTMSLQLLGDPKRSFRLQIPAEAQQRAHAKA